MAERPATSADVARLAGVSRTAVSLVLNDRDGRNVSAESRRRVLEAAEQLGYRPNRLARSLQAQRTSTLGLLTDQIATSPFAGQVLRGALNLAWERDYLLLVTDSEGEPSREEAMLQELLDRRCDGLLYAAMSLIEVDPPEAFHSLPAILVNCFTHADTLPAVVPDEVSGGRTATQALLDAGHRDIAMLAGTEERIAADLRITGHQAALAEAGVPAGPILRTGWSIDRGYADALRLLDAGDPPTGIVCGNDRVAAGVLLAAARLGIDVPERLSVVGYDDQEEMAGDLRPALTTVALPHQELGEQATRMLTDAIARGTPLKTERRLVRCELVTRASVGPAPTN